MRLVAGTSRRCASIALIPAFEEMPYMPFAMEIKLHHDLFGKCTKLPIYILQVQIGLSNRMTVNFASCGSGSTAVLSWKTVQEEFHLETLDFEHEYSVETWLMAMLSIYDLVIFVVLN